MSGSPARYRASGSGAIAAARQSVAAHGDMGAAREAHGACRQSRRTGRSVCVLVCHRVARIHWLHRRRPVMVQRPRRGLPQEMLAVDPRTAACSGFDLCAWHTAEALLSGTAAGEEGADHRGEA